MPSAEKIGKRWKGVARRMVNGEKLKRTKNFDTKREALAWARAEEERLEVGIDFSALDALPFSHLIRRYLDEVTPLKKSARNERLRLNRFLADYPHLARKPVSKFGRRDVVAWKEHRSGCVSPATVTREWNNLSAIFSYAQKDWGLPLPENPFHMVRRPKGAAPRNQRISAEAAQAIIDVLGYDGQRQPKQQREKVAWAFLFAIETAMRCGEICKLTAEDIRDGIAHLRETKNGTDRFVPLSPEARRLLSLVELPLGITPARVDALFRKYRPPELAHIRFHDTRHEALSRMAQKIHNPMTLAKISGHKDVKVLLNTYYNPQGEDLAGLLD